MRVMGFSASAATEPWREVRRGEYEVRTELSRKFATARRDLSPARQPNFPETAYDVSTGAMLIATNSPSANRRWPITPKPDRLDPPI